MSERAKFFWCLGSAWGIALLLILIPADFNAEFYENLHKGIKGMFVILSTVFTFAYLALADFCPDSNTGLVDVTIPKDHQYVAVKQVLAKTKNGGKIFIKVDEQYIEQLEPPYEEVATDNENKPAEGEQHTVIISNGRYIDMDVTIDNRVRIKNR